MWHTEKKRPEVKWNRKNGNGDDVDEDKTQKSK